jgi:ribonuclease P protein component
MTNGSQAIWAAAAIPAWGEPRTVRDNSPMPDDPLDLPSSRLRKHADYQRVYKESRKHFSPSMSYFFRLRGEENVVGRETPDSARVGLTAGRVLGKAVDRNRIKRRMREAVRMNLARLPRSVDVVLHPRKSVIDLEFRKLSAEVARIFSTVSSQLEKREPGKGDSVPTPAKKPGANPGAQR